MLCGDARSPDAYVKLLGDNKADLVFTDPPYNVRIDGHVSGLGRVQHREFAMASGEMTEDEFTAIPESDSWCRRQRLARRRLALRLHGLAPSV